MRIFPLIIVENKSVFAIVRRTLQLGTPEQELSEHAILHQAFEQPANLIRAPHEFQLDRRQHVFVRNDLVQGLRNGSVLLLHSAFSLVSFDRSKTEPNGSRSIGLRSVNFAKRTLWSTCSACW